MYRDIAPKNMVMEEARVVPKGSHFTNEETHSGRPGTFWRKERCTFMDIQYYYSLSRYYPEGNENATALGRLRGFEEIPELWDNLPYNPFRVDVYQLGITILEVIEVMCAFTTIRISCSLSHGSLIQRCRFSRKSATKCAREILMNARLLRISEALVRKNEIAGRLRPSFGKRCGEQGMLSSIESPGPCADATWEMTIDRRIELPYSFLLAYRQASWNEWTNCGATVTYLTKDITIPTYRSWIHLVFSWIKVNGDEFRETYTSLSTTSAHSLSAV
jgi:hypothetical protein